MAPDDLLMDVEEVLVTNAGPSVLLGPHGDRQSKQVVVMFIDGSQAGSIAVALRGDLAPRPLTHDLFYEVLSELGGMVEKVVIEEFIDPIFYGRLYVQIERDNETIVKRFDARPSDCVALALRSGAPIYATPKLLEQVGMLRTDVPGLERFTNHDDDDDDDNLGVSR